MLHFLGEITSSLGFKSLSSQSAKVDYKISITQHLRLLDHCRRPSTLFVAKLMILLFQAQHILLNTCNARLKYRLNSLLRGLVGCMWQVLQCLIQEFIKCILVNTISIMATLLLWALLFWALLFWALLLWTIKGK